jgi:hypothetical protein
MNAGSRKAWTEIVTPEDYDHHMVAIGQAQASADLVLWFLARAHPPRGSRVTVVGAGTGWMLDHVDLTSFEGLRFTFTDLSPRFLQVLRERVAAHQIAAEVLSDDIEASRLPVGMHLLIAGLVLEHIDWRIGVTSIAGLRPRFVGVVIQENPPGMTTPITPGRTLPASIEKASKVALSNLVPRQEVIRAFERLGYRCEEESVRSVADGKRLVGCLFCAAAEPPTT